MTQPLEIASSGTTSNGSRSGERLSNTAIACADASRRAGSFSPARVWPDPIPPEPVRVYGRDAFAGMPFKPAVMVPDPREGLGRHLLETRSFHAFSRPIAPRGPIFTGMPIDGPYDPNDAAEDDALLLAERGEPEAMEYDADAALSDYLDRLEEEDRRRDEGEEDEPDDDEELDDA